QFPALGRPAAAADSAGRRALARLGIAAAGAVSAPVLRARHTRHRPARDKMPDGMTCRLARAAGAALLCAAGDVTADTIYVSNEKDNTITVVDGASLTPVKTIAV